MPLMYLDGCPVWCGSLRLQRQQNQGETSGLRQGVEGTHAGLCWLRVLKRLLSSLLTLLWGICALIKSLFSKITFPTSLHHFKFTQWIISLLNNPELTVLYRAIIGLFMTVYHNIWMVPNESRAHLRLFWLLQGILNNVHNVSLGKQIESKATH